MSGVELATHPARQTFRNGPLAIRALAVWLGIMLLAIANGGVRQAILIPRIGPESGHVASTLILCAAIIATAYTTIRWMAPTYFRDAFRLGIMWLTLTVAFEFIVGHFVFGVPWETIIADYDVTNGRIWPLVPLVTLIAPVWAWIRRGR